jgi:hypothetical protein
MMRDAEGEHGDLAMSWTLSDSNRRRCDFLPGDHICLA